MRDDIAFENDLQLIGGWYLGPRADGEIIVMLDTANFDSRKIELTAAFNRQGVEPQYLREGNAWAKRIGSALSEYKIEIDDFTIAAKVGARHEH